MLWYNCPHRLCATQHHGCKSNLLNTNCTLNLWNITRTASNHRRLCNYSPTNTLHTAGLRMFSIHHRTKFRKPSYNKLLLGFPDPSRWDRLVVSERRQYQHTLHKSGYLCLKSRLVNNFITNKLQQFLNIKPLLNVSATIYSHLQGVWILKNVYSLSTVNGKIHDASILSNHQCILLY